MQNKEVLRFPCQLHPHRVLWLLEHPLTSFLWLLSETQELASPVVVSLTAFRHLMAEDIIQTVRDCVRGCSAPSHLPFAPPLHLHGQPSLATRGTTFPPLLRERSWSCRHRSTRFARKLAGILLNLTRLFHIRVVCAALPRRRLSSETLHCFQKIERVIIASSLSLVSS